MKRIPQPHSINLPPVRLYYDDLERLVEYYREAGEELRITTDTHELDQLADIKSLNKRVITTFTVRTSTPLMSLEFGPASARAYISDDSAMQRGVLEKVRALTTQRRQRLSWLTRNAFLVGAATSLPLMVGSAAVATRKWIWLVPAAASGVLIGLWNWYLFGPGSQRHSLIYTGTREEQPTFLERNRDKLALAIASALLSALVTLVVQWALK